MVAAIGLLRDEIPGLDELVDREAAFLAKLEDGQLLVGEILRTSGDAEVGDGFQGRGSDSNGAKSHVKGRCWDRLASQDLSPSVSQGTIWRYVAVDRRLGYA